MGDADTYESSQRKAPDRDPPRGGGAGTGQSNAAPSAPDGPPVDEAIARLRLLLPTTQRQLVLLGK